MAGGIGAAPSNGSPAAGGTGYSGQAGTDGKFNGAGVGGGGGGGGAGGGIGGRGGNNMFAPAQGGNAGHKDGFSGQTIDGPPSTGQGGNGGGGGAHGYIGVGTTLTGSGFVGGNGGNGSNGGYGRSISLGGGGYTTDIPGAGGGGAGGYGAVVTGLKVLNATNVRGGNGGAGGKTEYGFSGSGGDGGVGLFATASGVAVTNASTATATGGTGGAGGPGAGAGLGGAGIALNAAGSVTNAGVVVGGTGFGQSGQGVRFAASNSTLENTPGGKITGGAGSGDGRGGTGVAFAGSGNTLTNGSALANDARSTITGGAGSGGGFGGIGVSASGSTLTNQVNGSITGGAGGTSDVGGRGGNGIVVAGSTLTNAGTITGGAGGVGDSGSGAGQGGNGGTGVNANGGAVLTNQVGGVIRGGSYGTGGFTNGGGGIGVDLSNATLVNAGTVAGAYGGYLGTGGAGVSGSGIKIVNSGSIAGGSTADAITFTGGANTLAIGENGSFGGALNIRSASTTLTFDQSAGSATGVPADASVSTKIIGAGAIVKVGTGTLTLSGANTFTGGATVSAGTLSVSSDGNLGGDLKLAGGTLETTASFTSQRGVVLSTGDGVVQTDSGVSTVLSGTVSGNGALAKSGAGVLTLTGTNTYTGGTFVNAGTLSVSSDSNLGGDLRLAGGTLQTTTGFASAREVVLTADSTVQVDSGTTTFSSDVYGPGALIKTGAGTLTLSSDTNFYMGGTSVNGGTLSVSSDGNLGDASGGLTFNGGTLRTTASLTSGRAISLNALSSVQVTTGTTAFSGVVSGTGALTKTGTGTLALTGTNTYTGGTTLGAGTLSAGADTNLGAASGVLTFNGGTLQVTGTAFTSTGRSITWAAGGGGFDIADAGNNFTVVRNLTGGALTKSGAGTLTLSGQQNGYTGGTFLNAGRLSVSADTNLGDGSGGLTFAGGTLQTTQSFDTKRTVTLNGAGTVQTDSGVTNFRGAITNGAATGSLAKSGAGTLVLSNGSNTYSGGTLIQSGTLQLTQVRAAGTGAISFQAGAGGSATLVLDSAAQPTSGTFANRLDSFGDGDALNLNGFRFDSVATKVTYDSGGKTLTVSNGTVTQTFNMTRADPDDQGKYYAHDDGAGGTRVDNVVCFATGTMIRTVRGDVPVETLTIGDRAVTASGALRPIRWIGTRSFDCSAHPEPAMVRPVRIAAGAFGAGRPYCDLTLSPHHAVAVTCLDEVLIPIRLLVNGSSIKQIEEARAVTYWHVELDSHDILLANGLPAESYIDVGNRCDFEGEASLTLHPRFASDPLAAYCRPLVTGGGVLAAVRAQLAALVAEDAVASTPPFHLLVDGKMIAPVVKGDSAAFAIPAGTKDIRLVSSSWSPREVDPSSADDRQLGLMIQALSVEDLFGTSTAITLDDPSLSAGFHPPERNATGRWRWTDGDALIAIARLPDAGPFVLRVTGRFSAPRIEARPMAAAA